jgi:demethylmenaquinone methyltransferase/2-methoxy-6-polyprenyl-1,4-benzoquinol methylase
MALTKSQVRDLYKKRAANYDLSANLYYLIGFRENKYRKIAVEKLDLKPGDNVVEIGCGTGLNFRFLWDAVGEKGKIIGVDFSEEMLLKARERSKVNGWHNIELVNVDAADYEFPQKTNGVLSTFALTLVPEYEAVIRRASIALNPHGKLIVTDLKRPDEWPLWLVKFGVFITKPFGVTLDLSEREPWEAMRKHYSKVTIVELYHGFVYIAVGEK